MDNCIQFLRKFFLLTLFAVSFLFGNAQTSKEFWLAPPVITVGHAGNTPIYLRVTSGTVAATVTIDMPANPSFIPIVVNVPANSTFTQNLSAFVAQLETPANNVANNTGLHIVSTEDITCYYELSPTNNPDIWALKGSNGLGTEFYVPVQNIWPNGTYTPLPYTSFDIVATEDNTVVSIYPKTNMDNGHPALTAFTVFLNRGQTYSASVGQFAAAPPSQNPAGTVIVSNKDIAVSVKDDSVNPTGYGGCRDVMGDQIVPTNILGTEYIAQKGFLNDDDHVYVLAVDNNTEVYVDNVYQTTLFGGEMFNYSMSEAAIFINTSKPAYVIQNSGFGCEVGMAILPPLNCAGSESVSFMRSTSEQFGLNILVKDGNQGNFELNGDPNIIQAADFTQVPGDPTWVYAQYSWGNGNVGTIPVGTAIRVTNSTDVFALGLMNGGSTSGCRFGYFSEFSAVVLVDAGPDDVVCGNDTLQLTGDVSGGAQQGFWTTSGSGTFIPDEFDLNASYIPSVNDEANGSVILTLESIGSCTPVSDQTTITITPSPTIDLGPALSVCSNNPDVSLTATTTVATSALWYGGSGVFSPSNIGLNVTYTPTAAEISSGSIMLYANSAGNGTCNPVKDSVLINFTPSPTANAGPDKSVCANNAEVLLNGSVTVATGGTWSGGSGLFNPNQNALNVLYTPTAAEIANGSLLLTLSTTSNGNCNFESDQVLITFTSAPTVNAGVNEIYCSNNSEISLNGSISGATGGQWTGGVGSYSPNSTDLNAIYTPTVAELSLGSVTLNLESTGNGTCNAVSDQVTYTFSPSPSIDAGPNQSVCENNPTVSLSASVVLATGGQWSGGAGTFSPNANVLNPSYNPTAAEIAAGSMQLYVTSTGNGTCNPVKDSLTITFTPAPIANAGPDQTVCANNVNVNLNGSVIGASGGVWTGGSGTYNPSNLVPNPTYTPSNAEINAGSVQLTFTSSGNGNCNPVSDNITITINPAPVVSAGLDASVCSNNELINLNGSVSNAGGAIWSGGLGIYDPSNTDLTAQYTPSSAEVSLGSLTLTLTSTGNGTCIAETDQVTFTFTPSPVVDAGTNVNVCSDNSSISLSGSVSIASGGQWSTSGSGSFSPNNSNLSANYIPSALDKSNGSVWIYLTSIGNGNCNAVTDSMQISFDPLPSINAGVDQVSCQNNVAVLLDGQVNGATGAIWSGGSGVFNPSSSSLAATYIPSPAEIAAGSLTLTLTSTGNGLCSAVSDQMNITINPSPIVNAGADQQACANNADVTLSGSVQFASGGIWSGGNGGYSPSNTSLNAIYTPTAAEISSGSIVLTLTSTGNGSCLAVNDQVQIIFTPAPVVNAGLDQSVCANNNSVNLIGSVSGAGGGVWTGGIGSYSPNNTSLNVIYTPHPSEIANGSVVLTLTSSGNGTCSPVSDEIEITITPAPIVNAGNDVTTCVDDLEVPLSGSVSGSSSTGSWSSSGTGFFTPNNLVLNPTYVISSQDSINGGATIYLTSTGNGNCIAVTDSLNINVFPVGLANAGPDQSVCGNNSIVTLDGSISGNASSGIWSTSGSGSFVPNTATLDAQYIPSEDDIINGSVVLTLTANACNVAVDNMTLTITPSPIVYAGQDQTVCITDLDVQLSGVVAGATTTGVWTSSGTGTFVPSANVLNAIYTLSSADSLNQGVELILSSTANGNCLVETDTMNIFVYPTGTANAGADQTVCGNDAEVQLNGQVSGGADQGQWSTSGSGLFTPNDLSLDAIYIPSIQDINNGSVNLTLTTLNSCNQANDVLAVTINPAPIVTTYNDTLICGTNPVISLNGGIQNAGGGIWSTSGTGSFGSTTNLNTDYTASAADVSNGFVVITLSSTANGLCLPVSKSFTLTFSEGIFVSAGPDQEVCISASSTILSGVINNGTTTGIWTTFGDGTFDNNTSMNPTYTFGPNDISNGTVSIQLTSTNNGNCAVESDEMEIVFGSTVNVYAGPDTELCADNGPIQLNGIVSGGSSTGLWSSSGSGTFSPSATALNAIYTPSDNDSIQGGFDLRLVSTNNGGCLAGHDTTTYTLRQLPVISAGGNQTVCFGSVSVYLQASAINVDNLVWSSSGSGSFYPNNTSLQVIYLPSSADQQVASINITVSSVGSSPCSDVSNTIEVSFAEAFSANAGPDITTCGDDLIIQLNGQVFGTTTGQWSSSGSGFFFPTDNVLTAQYYASPADSLLGTVYLYLTPTNVGGCDFSRDSLLLTIQPVPVANGGGDQVVCANTEQLQLSGSILNATGSTWGTNGTGIFLPNPNVLDPIYQFSAQDQQNGQVILTLSTLQNGVCSNDVDSILIEMSNPLSSDFTWNGQCIENNIQFTDETVVNNGFIEAYQWNFGDGNMSSVQNPTNIFIAAGTYDVSLVVYSNLGCNDSIVQQVIIYDNPIPGFSWEETGTTFQVQFEDNSTGSSTFFWDFGDGSDGLNEKNPLYTYPSEGNYTVTQTVYSDQGCVDSTSQVVIVSNPDVYAPTTPSAFSPNGDGVNDVFYVRGGPFTSLTLRIYDTWGELIFESDEVDEGWDGYARGASCQIGEYVYVAIATTTAGKTYNIQGKVTLIK
jgi:gliding motility-associated-like protein